MNDIPTVANDAATTHAAVPAMKIETHLVPESTIEAFAVKHDLTMEVHEREARWVQMSHIGKGARFYAEFKDAEVKDGNCLRSAFGDGPTPDAAITDYGRNISEQLLIVDAYKPTRREIRVPRIVATIA